MPEISRRRLLKRINGCYSATDSYVERDVLFKKGREISLKPLLRSYSRILSSPEYTDLPPLLGAEKPLPIASMYIELAVAESREQADPLRLSPGLTLAEEQENRHRQKHARCLSIDQAINDNSHRNMVILGDPGSGKTSILKYLCLEIAKGNSKRWVLPIFISLRRYWLDNKNNPKSSIGLLHYAAIFLFEQLNSSSSSSNYSLHQLQCVYNNNKEQITDLEKVLIELSCCNHGNILFLLDGFDEVASQENAVEYLTSEIRQLGSKFSWVLTSRHTGFFGDLGEDIRYEMVSLHDQGINDLVKNWFKHTKQTTGANNKKQVLKQIQKNPRLKQMARNPFLLTLLCYLQQTYGRPLPLQRSEIYEMIFRIAGKQLQLREKDNSLFGLHEFNHLSAFCYHLYTKAPNAPLQLFDRYLWDGFAYSETETPPDLDKHFLASRLLSSWGDINDYHLIHLTFQEYLIAEHLSKQDFEQVGELLYLPHWRTVLRFLGGIYWRKDKEKYRKLLRLLFDSIDLLGLLYIEAAWLLLEAAIEDSTPILGSDLRRELWDIWLERAPYLEGAAGDALAVLCPDFVITRVKALLKKDTQNLYFSHAVMLLGKVNTEEADKLLLELYLTDSYSINNQALSSAIASKNTPELRQAILKSTESFSDGGMKMISLLAEKTRHADFLPILTTWLKSYPKRVDDYKPIFLALRAIASPKMDKVLLDFIKHYPIKELSFELLDAFATLGTQRVRDWFQDNKSKAEDMHLLIICIKHNLVDTKTMLGSLGCLDEESMGILITDLANYAETGGKTNEGIVDAIANIAFSNGTNSCSAFSTLIKIEFREIQNGKVIDRYVDKYRQYLECEDSQKCINAIFILGRLRDYDSYSAFSSVALRHNNINVRIASVNALSHFRDIYKIETLATLSEVLRLEKDRTVIEATLNSIAAVDFSELLNYPQIEKDIMRRVQTKACAEQGILLFKDSYVDRSGKRHYWSENGGLPNLNQQLNSMDYQKSLITVMQQLIHEGKASQAGVYRDDSGKIPLFKNTENAARPVDSVDKRTGQKLLKGEFIKKHQTVILLVKWILDKFPCVTEWAQHQYSEKLNREIHDIHIIAAAAIFSDNKSV